MTAHDYEQEYWEDREARELRQIEREMAMAEKADREREERMINEMLQEKEEKLSFKTIQERIADILQRDPDDMTDDEKEIFNEYLSSLRNLEAKKVDGFAFFIREQAARAEFLKAEAADLEKKSKNMLRKIDELKALYCQILQAAGKKRVEGEKYTLTIRETDTVLVKCTAEQLPLDFIRTKTTVEADKTKIKSYLKDSGSIFLKEGDKEDGKTLAMLFKKPSLIIR